MKQQNLCETNQNQNEVIIKSKSKKKTEFMQKAVLISLMLPFIWVTLSYILAWCEKPTTLEQLSMAVVSVPIATIISYATQNCIRAKWFKDKTQNERKRGE